MFNIIGFILYKVIDKRVCIYVISYIGFINLSVQCEMVLISIKVKALLVIVFSKIKVLSLLEISAWIFYCTTLVWRLNNYLTFAQNLKITSFCTVVNQKSKCTAEIVVLFMINYGNCLTEFSRCWHNKWNISEKRKKLENC